MRGMAQTKRTRQYYGSEYVDGSTVRQLDRTYESPSYGRATSTRANRSSLAAVPEREPYRRPEQKKNPVISPMQRTSWDLVSLLFMVAALSVTMYICVSYLRVQHDVVSMNKAIAATESELLELKNKNDAAYSKIDTSVDLAYIYKVATKELGMVHPVGNQVFSYNNRKSDYVRQYGEIPETEE